MAGFFEVKLQIGAPPQHVWGVLVDFEKYPDWNPFIIKVDGEAKIGSKITLHIKLDPQRDAMRFSEEMIVSLKENQHICFDSHVLSSSLFNSTRWQTIRPTSDGTSSIYHSHQKLSGIASWPVSRLLGDHIAAGFQSSSLALKKRVETLYQSAKTDA